jgi:hypothetical protein
MTGVVDMDFFVIAVRRLLRVAHDAKRSGCDRSGILKPLIKDFEAQWKQIVEARNYLEHVDDHNVSTYIVPMSSTNGDRRFGMPANSIDMRSLFIDAERLAEAINAVIAPYIRA